jgi:hypothetical protein
MGLSIKYQALRSSQFLYLDRESSRFAELHHQRLRICPGWLGVLCGILSDPRGGYAGAGGPLQRERSAEQGTSKRFVLTSLLIFLPSYANTEKRIRYILKIAFLTVNDPSTPQPVIASTTEFEVAQRTRRNSLQASKNPSLNSLSIALR